MTIDWNRLLVALLKTALTELDPSSVRLSDDDMPISELELSVRTQNCLTNEGIRTVSQLRQKTDLELLRICNLGRKGLVEIREQLRARAAVSKAAQ